MSLGNESNVNNLISVHCTGLHCYQYGNLFESCFSYQFLCDQNQ